MPFPAPSWRRASATRATGPSEYVANTLRFAPGPRSPHPRRRSPAEADRPKSGSTETPNWKRAVVMAFTPTPMIGERNSRSRYRTSTNGTGISRLDAAPGYDGTAIAPPPTVTVQSGGTGRATAPSGSSGAAVAWMAQSSMAKAGNLVGMAPPDVRDTRLFHRSPSVAAIHPGGQGADRRASSSRQEMLS